MIMKRYLSLFLLALLPMLALTTFTSCGDDEDDLIDEVVSGKTVKVNGINVIGMWVDEDIYELYEFKSDGTAILYEIPSGSRSLVNGILQCFRSNLREEARGTWTHKDNYIVIGGLIITIKKKISDDEAEVNVFGEDAIFKRVKGFVNGEVTVSSADGTTNGHGWVNLGLPSGTLWATCNVGASKPEEYGNYYAWGETKPKDVYNWDTYFDSDYQKYNRDGVQVELFPEDDAATAKWGSKWQMPSLDQIDELIDSDYTTTEWRTMNGKCGYKITSRSNGKSIFLPAAGSRDGTSLYRAGSRGYYWSRSLDTSYSDDAYYLYFNSDDIYSNYYYRCYGRSVRPVRVKN